MTPPDDEFDASTLDCGATQSSNRDFADATLLGALRDLHGVACAPEIAERVGCSSETVHYRFNSLLDESLATKKIGECRVWWFSDREPTATPIDYPEPDNRNYDDQAFLNAVYEQDGVSGAGDVSDVVGCTRRTAYNRLNSLADNYLLFARTLQPSRVWWLPELVPEGGQATLDDF
jgi:hypothetical protein